MPLQVADPEDEIGDDGGAGVEFEAQKLMGIDGIEFLGLAEGGEGFEDFAFEALEVFEGDVEEVTGAAGGIEDKSVAEFAVELAGGLDGGGGVSGVDEVGDSGDGGLPVLAERFDDGGDDEAFDVGARGVVGAEGGTLVLVEGAFEEGAEAGGLDVAPVGVGGFDEEAELVAVDGEGRGGFEEATVELLKLALEDGGEAARVHGLPHGGDGFGEVLDVFAVANFVEQVKPGVAGDELDVFGEGGKDAAGEELRDCLWGMLLFEIAGQGGEFCGDLAGDFGGAAGRIERVGIEPEGAKAGLDFRVRELTQEDAVGAGVGEREVGFAGEGEVGIELDGVADVDGDYERGPLG